MKKVKDDEICSRIKGLLFGCAIGDAIGIPFETMKYPKIQEFLKKKPAGIYFTAAEVGNSSEYFPADVKATFTDDTQLTIAVMRALVSSCQEREFIFSDLMENIAKEHVIQYKKTLDGWGGGTKRSVKRLLEKSHTYKNSGNSKSSGCGVLMKIAPLGFFYAFTKIKCFKKVSLVDQVSTFCKMTHKTSSCLVTANLYVSFLIQVFKTPKLLESTESRCKLLKSMRSECVALEKRFGCKGEVSERLLEYEEQFEALQKDDGVILQVSRGGTCFNVNSFSLVIGVLLSGAPEFSMIEKAAFLGGDTDSNAAQVGAVVGGILGCGVIPKEYLEQLNGWKGLQNDSESFSKLFAK